VILHVPELLPEDPLVQLIYLGKQADLMGWFPNSSAASLIAWDVSFLAALGAAPSMTVKCSDTEHISHNEHITYKIYNITYLPHTYSCLQRCHGIIWDLETKEIKKDQQP
jgi:hypothetical protein